MRYRLLYAPIGTFEGCPFRQAGTTTFVGQGMKDYIAMLIIWYATQAPEQQKSGTGQNGDITEVLKKLEGQIDKYL